MNTETRMAAGRRQILWAGVLSVILLWACDNGGPVRLGFIGGTSGRVADAGISARDAALMAVAERNAAGGIDGRKVLLVAKDDRGDPETARSAVKALIDAGVTAIIGPITSNIAVAVTPMTNQARLVMVSPTVATLAERDDYFFRIAPTTKTYAEKSAHFLFQTRGFRSVTALFDLNNRAFTKSWVDHFTRLFTTLGGTVNAAVGFKEGGGPPLLDLCRDALASRPDCLLIVANSMDASLVCQQIRKLDAATPIALSDWGATERLLELGGGAVEGVIVVQGFNRELRDPRYLAFQRDYLARYQQTPSHTAINGYDAAVVLMTALDNQRADQDLKQAILATKTFAGVQGEFRFDGFGDAVRFNTSISIVRDRQFVVVE